MSVKGLAEAMAALDEIGTRAEVAAAAIVRQGEALIETQAKRSFTGAHSRGTPTPSSPGSPPSVIGGTLRRSITSDPVTTDGPVARGRVYPTVVYARIQELGGVTGRGHHTNLPPRPYMGPSRGAVAERIGAIAISEWTLAVTG